MTALKRSAIVMIALVLAVLTACAGSPTSPPVESASSSVKTDPTISEPAPRTFTATTSSPSPREDPDEGLSPSEIRDLTLCDALENDEIGDIVFSKDAGDACRDGEAGADDVLLCDAIYDSDGELWESDGETANADVVGACPVPEGEPTPSEIRRMTLCDALTDDRVDGIVYLRSDGEACEDGAAGAERVLLCEAIYDDEGNLRENDGTTVDPDIADACPEPSTPPSGGGSGGSGGSGGGDDRGLDGRDGTAPFGITTKGVWWSQGADRFSPSNLWVFDPVGEALPNGYQVYYQPVGTITPVGQRFPFVYTQRAGTLSLSYPSGSEQTLVVQRYDPATDTLTVTWEGSTYQWAGCRSGRMPEQGLVLCD